MTEEQIIKALECCVKDDEGVLGFCNKGCPLFSKDEDCPELLRRNALDLINRQKAEVEEQHRKIDFLQASKDLNQAEFDEVKAELELKKAEIERLKEKNWWLEEQLEDTEQSNDKLCDIIDNKLKVIYKLHEQIKIAKSEAIKEFADKVDHLIATNIGVSNRSYNKLSADIKDLVKEMEGETKWNSMKM